MENPFIQCALPILQDQRIIKPLQEVCEKCQSSDIFKMVKTQWDSRTEQLVVYEVSQITWCPKCLDDPEFKADQVIQCYLQIEDDERLSNQLRDVCKRCETTKVYRIAKLRWDQKVQQLVVFDASHIIWCSCCKNAKGI